MKESLGNKIKRLRIERNMTQDELAKILGYSSRSTINKIESDINTLSYDKLLKLVDVFKIDINELINRVDELRKDNNINEGDDMYINELIDFIYKSPVAYNAISTIKSYLLKEGFIELYESNSFDLKLGNKYFVTRNGTSIIAFTIPNEVNEYGFNIIASHSDSPCFKVKPNTDLKTGVYHKVSVEPYGGMICSSWFDRPLSLAGRVIVKEENMIIEKEVNIDRPLLSIVNVPIHMNRTINDGYKYNMAIDMQPLLTQEIEKVDLKGLLAKEMNLVKENIINYDLYICNKEKGYVFGLNNEYFSSPRIDNLECAFTSLKGFLKGTNKRNINVYACFDNEEVGSGTRQGADSSFLEDTLRRINEELGFNESKYLRAVSSSLMVSADNAHALHPNHPELYDGLNNVLMNKGIVIKVNAAQSYATDGLSSALFTSILDKVNVPYQYFTNRADLRGGGTLGNISSKHVSMMCVDMGLPQLAMHSSNETAGVKDVDYAIKAFEKYYSVSIINKNGSFIIEE